MQRPHRPSISTEHVQPFRPNLSSSSSSPTSPSPSSAGLMEPRSRRSLVPNSPPLFYIDDSDDEPVKIKKTTLPLFGRPSRRSLNGGAGGGSGAGRWGRLSRWSWKAVSRVLRNRAWMALICGSFLFGTWYYYSGSTGKSVATSPSVAAPTKQQGKGSTSPESQRKRPRPPLVPPLPPAPAPRIIDVDVRPPLSSLATSPPSTSASQERYLAYSPHSGYHNQRISLENALTLAFILGRTLLLPPVWLGHAIPYISTDKLQRRLRMASKEGLERCKEFAEGASDDPLPRECEGYFDWSLVHWDFMVDLSEAKELVQVKDRWNHTAEWLEEELGLAPHNKAGVSPDVYYINDDSLYQFRFYDTREDEEPLAKFANRKDLITLAFESESYKLLHVGSLFGTSRFHVQEDENFNARSTFRKSMVFKNPLLDEITTQIRDRLGGPGNYYGLHLRVGDGVFQKSAPENMAGVWQNLCVTKMKLTQAVCDEVGLANAKKGGQKPVAVAKRGETIPIDAPPSAADSPDLVKRANSRPQREGAYHHAPLPPLPIITTRASSPLSSTLSCRSPLHTSSHLLPFNAPLFIATDSKVPTADRNLAIFFDAFPCTFVLSDFGSTSAINKESIEGLGKLAGLRNKEDKVPLAQFLYPQLDAQIAAYGRDLVGTPQSTYSRFAVDVLYQFYHGWDIVERG